MPKSTRAARPPAGVPMCDSRLRIRHCTLVPGWSIGPDCTRCGLCVDTCPTGSLTFEIKGLSKLL